MVLATALEEQTVVTSFDSDVGRTGTFVLQYGGATTEPLAWDTSSSDLKIALEGLATISSVDVSDALPVANGYSYDITFTSQAGNLDLIAAQDISLSNNGDVTISPKVDGDVAHIKSLRSPLQDEVQTVRVVHSGTTLAATFNSRFKGTHPIISKLASRPTRMLRARSRL